MKNHIIRTKSVECCKSDDVLEYASECLAVDIILAQPDGPNTELVVFAYNSKMHLLGTDSHLASQNGSHCHYHFEINSAELWDMDTYTFFIFRNGKPHWQAHLQLWGALGCDAKGYLEPIELNSKEMRFLSQWRHDEWWCNLDQMQLPESFVEDFTDWVMRYELHKNHRRANSLPALVIVANEICHGNFINKVIVRFISRDVAEVVKYNLGDILQNEQPLLNLECDLKSGNLVVINLSLSEISSNDITDILKQFTDLILNGVSGDTKLVLHGSSYDIENIVDKYRDFKNIIQDNDMIVYPGTPDFDFGSDNPASPSSDFDELLDNYISSSLSGTAPSMPIEVAPPNDNGFSLDVPSMESEKEHASIDTAFSQLNKMVGLTRLKEEFATSRILVQFNKLRQQLKLDDVTENRNHMLFLGNPGTGKTSVAKLVAKMYHEMGLLTNGQTIETNRTELIGEYIGQTEFKTLEVIEKARGGVLFIDEAYTLITSDHDAKDFGKEVINALLTVLSDPNPDLIVIMAGYEDKMERLMSYNPGLRDRFPLHFHFDDFSVDELMQMAHNVLHERHYYLSNEAEKHLRNWVIDEVASKDPYFSNGRWIHNIIAHHIIVSLARRVMQLSVRPHSKELFSRIEAVDIDDARRKADAIKSREYRDSPRIGFTA